MNNDWQLGDFQTVFYTRVISWIRHCLIPEYKWENNEHAGCPDCCLYVQFSTRGTTVLRDMTDSWAGVEKYKMNQEYLLLTESLLGVKRCQEPV